MRVLTFTSLYPSEIDPRHGIFVKNRMDHFDAIEGTTRKVIAPIQYFPLLGLNKNSKFHKYNRIPKQETQKGIPVFHPRYTTIPGSNLIDVARAMVKSADKFLPDLYPGHETFDLVDGHYLYPDGVAAYQFAKKHQKPLFLTARGSDVNFWMEQSPHKEKILEALSYAYKVICVSQDLKNKLIAHGVAEEKLIVLMNGVDSAFFTASDTLQNKEGGYLLSIGNLVPLKGHEFILRALPHFPDEKLVIIGTGEKDTELKKLAQDLNIGKRVTFIPHVPHNDLPSYYAKAKCTILMSSMEGMPNVILESLAAGCPAIATNVGGIPEIVNDCNGVIINNRSENALIEAIKYMLVHKWNRREISKQMHYLDWTETAQKLYQIFSEPL